MKDWAHSYFRMGSAGSFVEGGLTGIVRVHNSLNRFLYIVADF